MSPDELKALPTSRIVFSLRTIWRRGLFDRIFRTPGFAEDCLDVVVDGISLHKELNRNAKGNDLVFKLDEGPCEPNDELIDEWLLRSPASLPNDRRPLFGCHVCWDLWCGTYSIKVERTSSWVVWSDFAFQTPGIKSPSLHEYADLGPFKFDAEEYEDTLLNIPTIESLKEQSQQYAGLRPGGV